MTEKIRKDRTESEKILEMHNTVNITGQRSSRIAKKITTVTDICIAEVTNSPPSVFGNQNAAVA
jgi:hypothetical protein